ncbi:unnamed protein product [Schistocephalus solidus]|uniref:Secreted protein n=1 Tax=Schistocephalus solidus TaxID=70667 RepID=A0A183TFX8_SCHSO|nr:unnamed protein product [Schistocephalus solidus]
MHRTGVLGWFAYLTVSGSRVPRVLAAALSMTVFAPGVINSFPSVYVQLPVVITSSIGDPQADPMDTLTQQLPALAPSQLSPTSPNPPRRKSSCSLDASGSSGALVSPRFPRKNLSGGNSFLTNSSHLQQQQQQQGVSSPASNSLGDSDDDFDASSHEVCVP